MHWRDWFCSDRNLDWFCSDRNLGLLILLHHRSLVFHLHLLFNPFCLHLRLHLLFNPQDLCLFLRLNPRCLTSLGSLLVRLFWLKLHGFLFSFDRHRIKGGVIDVIISEYIRQYNLSLSSGRWRCISTSMSFLWRLQRRMWQFHPYSRIARRRRWGRRRIPRRRRRRRRTRTRRRRTSRRAGTACLRSGSNIGRVRIRRCLSLPPLVRFWKTVVCVQRGEETVHQIASLRVLRT